MRNNITPKLDTFIAKLPKRFKPVASYLKLHEAQGSFAHIRFAQDTIVNWVPKVFFSRSLADFTDMSFLELTENVLVYYGGKFLGEGVFRKHYAKKIAENLKEKIPVRAEELLNNSRIHSEDPKISIDVKKKLQEDNKKLMPVKAALAISALVIPLAEYSLSYVKNLFTLKLFKQSDFNNIANLNKNIKEDAEKQKQVKESAKQHLKLAGGIFAGCLGLSALLLTRGKHSPFLQSLSEYVLAPGNKIFKPKSGDSKEVVVKLAEKAKKFNNYFSIDFDSVDVKDKLGNPARDKYGNIKKKLALSKGQIVACVLFGFLGYTGAAKDRGKQNLLEVLFRYPIVTFYVITGADLFIAGFKKILRKKGGYEEMLGGKNDKDFKMPSLKELPELAKGLANKKGIGTKAGIEAEFKRLFKQKATIIGVPTLFSLFVMGFFVAGYSRFFTQYRYNKEMKEMQKKQQNMIEQEKIQKFKNQFLKL